jgi:hypothetical protein
MCKRDSSGRSNHYHRSTLEPVGLDSDEYHEEGSQLGLEAFDALEPATRGPMSLRHRRAPEVAECGDEAADRPLFNYRLPHDQAMADVEKVWGVRAMATPFQLRISTHSSDCGGRNSE